MALLALVRNLTTRLTCTCIATLPWIALLALSASIELVSSAARVTSVKFQQRLSLTHTPCANLTDVTLADEDTNSILTDNANRAIHGNVLANFGISASGAIWWPNVYPMHVHQHSSTVWWPKL